MPLSCTATIGGAEVLLDLEDAHLLDRAWHLSAPRKPGYPRYVRHKLPRGSRPSCLYLHRLIACPDEGQVVDHINGNTLDNRRANLRVCSHGENTRNRGAQSNNLSGEGLKGAWWHAQRGYWVSQICVSGKRQYLGRFDTEEQAHAAYAAASKNLHGEFANVG